MFKELTIDNKEEFIFMVKDFYRSEAVINSIPTENIINTFKEAVSGSPFVKAYLIQQQDTTAGYALLSFTYSNEAGGLVVWIEELFIKEEFRGLGLGGKILDFIQQKFSNRAKRFRLEISEANISVKKLYLHKGFKSLEYIQMVKDVN